MTYIVSGGALNSTHSLLIMNEYALGSIWMLIVTTKKKQKSAPRQKLLFTCAPKFTLIVKLDYYCETAT